MFEAFGRTGPQILRGRFAVGEGGRGKEGRGEGNGWRGRKGRDGREVGTGPPIA